MPTLNWIGKEKVINHHQDVPFRVLERKYSYDENGQHDEDNGSENMIIRGDNLEALKALLPKYEGRVKCIYIDPVAVFAIAVAVCMFIMMGVGLAGYANQKKETAKMQAYVTELRTQNDVLEEEYLHSYDVEEVEHTALALGMVHKGQNQVVSLEVTPPVQQEATTVTLMDRIGTFLTSLFA